MKTKDSLKNMVYDRILEGIFTDEYKPNQILNEKELVEKFGCSKSPVREALITLCNEGVLRSFPRYGYEVVRLTKEDVEQILRFRMLLEGGSLRECAGSLTEEDLKELERIDEGCQMEPADLWSHWDANTRFHMGLLSYGKNAYALDKLEESMKILKRAYAQFYWQIWKQVSPSSDTVHHKEIINSLRAGKMEQAVQYLKEDLQDFCI